jgi:hydrogenase nickel incorporation protein HypA/HybF
MVGCNNICTRYEVHRLPPTKQRYFEHRKRCTSCEVYLIWHGSRCPCCRKVLRTRPRNRFGISYGKVRLTYKML